MVVSSFESVAGLGSATPYIPMALKSVSKHFRCLKNSISDQLKLISEALGEDLSIPCSTSTCSNKADTTTMARVRCGSSMDQSFFLKNKCVKGTTELLDEPPQQHVWRPQRGLPERAVAILKAWLFEHFLHPYVCLYYCSCSLTLFFSAFQRDIWIELWLFLLLLLNFFSVTLQTLINTCWLVKQVFHETRWGPFSFIFIIMSLGFLFG